MEIYAFSILRNGVKYDYCFKESILSLIPLVTKFVLVLGDCDDQTEQQLEGIEKLEIIRTVWDPNKREGGEILSEQTNIGLSHLRNLVQDKKAWAIYIQADEVVHEDDLKIIKEDIHQAENEGFDCLKFRYLHFWQEYHRIAINKKWYPNEIRAFSLKSSAQSWGDAQSFKGLKRPFFTDAYIYHYGHVREPNAYNLKRKDILKLYGHDQLQRKLKGREKKWDRQTKCISFWGNHPQVMTVRLRKHHAFEVPAISTMYIFLPKSVKDSEELKNILINSDSKIKKVFYQNYFSYLWAILQNKLSGSNNLIALDLSENLLTNFLHYQFVPKKMKSKLAQNWDRKMYIQLKLSKKIMKQYRSLVQAVDG